MKRLLKSSSFSRYYFIISIIAIILLRLWLTSSLSLQARNTPHDELLFLRIAENIIKGEWLGDYNNKTLAKGMFYPLWIAFSFYLGVSLLLTQQLLYVFASLVFIKAIKPIIASPAILLVVFLVIIFNPISYSSNVFGTLLREGVYSSLTLLIISSTIGLYLRRMSTHKSKLLWILLLGLSLGAFWLTREESIWVAPFVFLLLGAQLIETVASKDTLKKKLIAATSTLSPLIIFKFSLVIVSLINLYKYSTFNYVEFKAEGFTSAYGALTRVNSVTWEAQTPMTKPTREKVYSASPAFAELEPYLEGDLGNGWSGGSLSFGGASFMWVLRDAVELAGYYKDGGTAENYYKHLALEINNACVEGKLKCSENESHSFAPAFRREYLHPLQSTIISIFKFVTSYTNFTPFQSNGDASLSDYLLYSDITRSNMTPLIGQDEAQKYQSHVDNIKLDFLSKLGTVYSNTSSLLFIFSIITMVIGGFKSLWRKDISKPFLIISGLFGIFIARILLVSYVHVSSFSAISILYLSSAHILLCTIIGFSIGWSLDAILKYYRKRG